MNFTARLEKLEAKLQEITLGADQLDYVILYKRDESGVEYYQIRKDNGHIWVTKEELDKYLGKYPDGKGPIIFMPIKRMEES